MVIFNKIDNSNFPYQIDKKRQFVWRSKALITLYEN